MKSKIVLIFFVVLCSFVFSVDCRAVEIHVEFNESLTNETSWVYGSNTKISDENGFYISSGASVAVESPVFDFAVTSVVVVAHLASEDTTRSLYALPITDDGVLEDKKCDITPPGPASAEISCGWTREACVRKIGFKIAGGSGNVYLLSAKIYGVSIPYPPENLEAARVGGRQITVKWQNPENAVEYKLGVYKSSWNEESFETVASYDFNQYSNEGGSNQKLDTFDGSYSDFSGSTLIYLPAKSAGQIQISKREEKGVLKHRGFGDYDSLSVDMTVRKYFHVTVVEEDGGSVIKEVEDNGIMTIGYEKPAGMTNDFARVDLEKEFKREIIPLKDFPANTPILFNATGNKTNHRVIIDEMKFIKNYSPAGERHELVQEINTSESKIRLSNLERNTDYVIKVTAIDADGKESENVELRVKTSSQNDSGFFIRIQ